jgi:NitT/TauT family transport system permease protein
MSLAPERAGGMRLEDSAETVPDLPAEPSRFSLKHPRSRIGWIRPAIWLPLVIMLVVLGVAWQRGAKSMPYLLPPLSSVGHSLSSNLTYYIRNAGTTLGEAVAGLVMGFVAAFILAVLMSEVAVIRRAVMPLAIVLNVTPVVAIAPVMVVAFGFGPEPKLIITALICFFPFLINTAVGLRSVPQQVTQVYQTMNASRLEQLIHLRIPNAMPYLFAALRIVCPLSIIGAVVAEMSASGSVSGLGTVISNASTMNQLPVVYAAIFILAIMGVLLMLIITVAERRALRWHESSSDRAL